MKKSVLSMVAVAAFAVPAVMADTIGGVYLGADLHFADAKGSFGQTGNQQDFQFDDKNLSSFYKLNIRCLCYQTLSCNVIV